jgi:rsbT co-antagonist protein RsbR
MSDTRIRDGPEAEESPAVFPPPGGTHVVLPLSPEEQTLADRAKKILFDAELAGLVVEHLPDAVVIVDDAGVIQRVNAKAELLFGYTRAEMIGQMVELLVPESLREQHRSHRAGYMEEPHMRPMGLGLVLKAQHKNGSDIPVDINLAPVVTTKGVWVIASVRRKR